MGKLVNSVTVLVALKHFCTVNGTYPLVAIAESTIPVPIHICHITVTNLKTTYP